jgi:hypothetical protein
VAVPPKPSPQIINSKFLLSTLYLIRAASLITPIKSAKAVSLSAILSPAKI